MRVSREWVVVVVALGLATYEIVLGEARPAVLTFLTGLFLSPLVTRVDHMRRRNGAKS